MLKLAIHGIPIILIKSIGRDLKLKLKKKIMIIITTTTTITILALEGYTFVTKHYHDGLAENTKKS